LIRSDIIDWFLNRELPNNFDWVKSLPIGEIERRLSTYQPSFHTAPFEHQKRMILLCLEQSNMLLFAQMGLGKSKSILDTISIRKQKGQIKRTLILSPDLPNIMTWVDQCKLHTPSLSTTALYGTKPERLQLLKNDTDLYIINYIGLQVILASPNPDSKKRLILQGTVKDFAKNFDCIVYDECVAVKHTRSITYKICKLLSENIKYRYGLTGTPMGRDVEDLWAEFYVIDQGDTLGKNPIIFREAYFKSSRRPWAVEWKFKKELEPKLHLVLKNRSIRYKTEECQDLPPRIPNIINIRLSQEAADYYHKIVGDLQHTIYDSQWAAKIKNHFIKLSQVCSGYLITTPEDSEKAEEIDFVENEKIKALSQIVALLPDDCKMIIFHEFTPSGRMITEELKRLKINHHWLYGGTKSKIEVIKSFQEDPKVKVLVANTHSGAVGLNLQISNYTVFYECPVSPIVRVQAEARSLRTGQTKSVFIYDLIVQNSVEEKIQSFIKEGKNLLQALLEGSLTVDKLMESN
jgi:SNF2 family DNA or RNA helicase